MRFPNLILYIVSLVSPLSYLHAGAWQQLQEKAKESGVSAQQLEQIFKLSDPFQELREKIKKEAESKALFPVIEEIKDQKHSHYLLIRESQLEKPFIFSSTMERGIGERGVYSTMMDDTFIFSFRRVVDQIQFVRRQMEYRADAGTPELKAIEHSMPDDILAILPVVSSDSADGYFVISAEALFLKDLTHVGRSAAGRAGGAALSLSGSDSLLQKIAAFPKNVEVQAQLIFSVSGTADHKEKSSTTDKLLPIVMRYSLTAMPENSSFEPRPADPRVGYFTTDYRDLSRPDLKDRIQPDVHLINRWNLEKKEPPAPVSEVKKPITFWLEDTIPLEYRDALRAGILAWNAAFEALGFKDAVVVKEVDKDMTPAERASFDPADISYNMIRWFVGKDAGFAVGPSRVNPLTGEIFNASISVSDIMSRVVGEFSLASSAGAPAASGRRRKTSEAEDLAESRQEAEAALSLLEASGSPLPDSEKKRFVQEFLIETIAHEVGHTLGLRHNFKASEWLPQEDLDINGLHSASVMDYLPAYIAPPGKPQGSYFQKKIGPYDAWAVEYGYKPLSKDASIRKEQLKAIAARADADPSLAYETDESAGGIDPDVQRWDMGRGQLPFSDARVALARNLWNRLDSQAAAPGTDNVRLKETFSDGLKEYSIAVRSVLPLIGGVRTTRGNGRQFAPVAGSEQRLALEFLDRNVFDAKAFQISPRLLQSLGNDRFSEDSSNEPFPIADRISNLQDSALDHLFAADTLQRLRDQEVFGQDKDALTPRELMDHVRRSIWDEIYGKQPRSIALYRRNLQRRHLDILAQMLKNSHVGDAQADALRDLRRLDRDLHHALKNPGHTDEATVLHLKAMLRQIHDALDPASHKSS